MNLTVYVPDALHKRLERHRDQINVSAVLQRCLQRELDALESAVEASQEAMDEAIRRLVAEKTELEGRSRDRGMSEGLKWALSAPYEQLAAVQRGHQRLQHTAHVSFVRVQALLKKICGSTLQPLETWEDRIDSAVEREAYVFGVLEGILKVWSRLQEASSEQTSSHG
jgi:post-segregation antitoxin (ccd killing protein)